MKMHIFRLGAAILALIAAVGKLPLTAAVYPQAVLTREVLSSLAQLRLFR